MNLQWLFDFVDWFFYGSVTKTPFQLFILIIAAAFLILCILVLRLVIRMEELRHDSKE